MTRDRETKDPNVDTFDHVGEREHEAPPAIEPITASALRIGPPASARGEIFAAGCIKPTSGIPVTRMFDSGDVIGIADVAADGTVTIRLAPGVEVPAGAHVEIDGDNPRSSWVTQAAPTCEARS